jgi:hypothetical protein
VSTEQTLAEQLLAALPPQTVLSSEHVGMIGELVGGRATWTYSSMDRVFSGLTIGDKPVGTIGELRSVIAGLPELEPGTDSWGVAIGKGIADGLRPLIHELIREIVETQARLGALVEELEARGDLDALAYARHWHRNYERDVIPRTESYFALDEKNGAAWRARHADWMTELDRRATERFGLKGLADLQLEWDALQGRLAAVPPPATEGDASP